MEVGPNGVGPCEVGPCKVGRKKGAGFYQRAVLMHIARADAMDAMPWIPLAILVAVMILVIVFASRFQAEQTRRFREAWREFAANRGYAWVQASGPWYRRSTDAIDATIEGEPIRFDTYVVSTGKTTIAYTRVASSLERDVPAKITIAPRSSLTAMGESLGFSTVRTGDASFDARMAVRSKNEAFARRVVDEDVRARALDIGRRIEAKVEGRTAKVAWRAREKDTGTLDAAGRFVAALRRSIGRS